MKAKANSRPALLPRDLRDPTGTGGLEAQAVADFRRRMRAVRDVYRAALERVPVAVAVNARYEFRLDQALLRALLAQADLEVEALLLAGGENGLWFMEAYVEVAAQRGAAQAHANLARQSPTYKAGRGSVAAILRSEPYQRRMTLIRARVFEEMKAFTAQARADMSRVLTEGIGRGQNPKTIAQALSVQTNISTARAARIARTEVTTALRRARWDESEDAQQLYGMKTMQMHLSALSPTTRVSHARRHAKLFTVDEVREWYSQDANAINCRCAQVAVMVDKEGAPLVPAIQQKARDSFRNLSERDYPWAKELT